jgi:cation/acetate symporter
VVAFAFGLAASTFFPALVAGIFWRRATREGAVAGMLAGFALTFGYVGVFGWLDPSRARAASWWLGISPEGIGAVGLLVNLAVLVAVSLVTRPPPAPVQALVASLRYPREPGRR